LDFLFSSIKSKALAILLKPKESDGFVCAVAVRLVVNSRAAVVKIFFYDTNLRSFAGRMPVKGAGSLRNLLIHI
jgi:hypothetical protein